MQNWVILLLWVELHTWKEDGSIDPKKQLVSESFEVSRQFGLTLYKKTNYCTWKNFIKITSFEFVWGAENVAS
jgi:hypothetical protein